MGIAPGIGLYLKLPYADGGTANKYRPYLVIDFHKNTIDMLNISSVRGKEKKLLYPSNELLDVYNPPFCRPSFVKLDGLYKMEYFEDLKYCMLANGRKLNEGELSRIISKFESYKKDKKVNFMHFDTEEVFHYNYKYISKQLIAAESDLK